MPENFLFEQDGPIATITFNRPERRNCMNREVMGEFENLILRVRDGRETRVLHLGPDLGAGERPQAVVPARYWQAAESLGAWTLMGCTVAPGFDFAGFELAPAGWQPG